MSSRDLYVACFALWFVVPGPARSQALIAPDSLVQQLRSASPVARASAFGKLSRIRGAFAAPGMAQLLLRTLDRENQLMWLTLQQSHGTASTSDRYGEAYSEYGAALFDACMQYCDRRDPNMVQVIVGGLYPTEGPVAQWLAADHGPEILPAVLRNAHGGTLGREIDAVAMLGTIAQYSRSLPVERRRDLDTTLAAAASSRSVIVPEVAVHALSNVLRDASALSLQQRTLYHQAIQSATTSNYANVRVVVIGALAEFGDATDRGLLKRLADQDTARSVDSGGQTTYPVREAAKRAIIKLPPL
jgi:hypothetical protein